MTPKEIKRASRRLALVLRHQPATIDLDLDHSGWADVQHLLQQLRRHGTALSSEDLQRIVAENDKQRFRFSEDGRRIRANQGHSIPVDLQLAPLTPPDVLYHGTATHALDGIYASGIENRSRRHVHLSADLATASAVGKRHGKLIILTIDAAGMHAAGHHFYRSDNGVWLTDYVPKDFLKV